MQKEEVTNKINKIDKIWRTCEIRFQKARVSLVDVKSILNPFLQVFKICKLLSSLCVCVGGLGENNEEATDHNIAKFVGCRTRMTKVFLVYLRAGWVDKMKVIVGA